MKRKLMVIAAIAVVTALSGHMLYGQAGGPGDQISQYVDAIAARLVGLYQNPEESKGVRQLVEARGRIADRLGRVDPDKVDAALAMEVASLRHKQKQLKALKEANRKLKNRVSALETQIKAVARRTPHRPVGARDDETLAEYRRRVNTISRSKMSESLRQSLEPGLSNQPGRADSGSRPSGRTLTPSNHPLVEMRRRNRKRRTEQQRHMDEMMQRKEHHRERMRQERFE